VRRDLLRRKGAREAHDLTLLVGERGQHDARMLSKQDFTMDHSQGLMGSDVPLGRGRDASPTTAFLGRISRSQQGSNANHADQADDAETAGSSLVARIALMVVELHGIHIHRVERRSAGYCNCTLIGLQSGDLSAISPKIQGYPSLKPHRTGQSPA
jgi:hypothetical protein